MTLKTAEDVKSMLNTFKTEMSNKIDDVIIPATRSAIEDAINEVSEEVKSLQSEINEMQGILNDFDKIADKSHELITLLDDA